VEKEKKEEKNSKDILKYFAFFPNDYILMFLVLKLYKLLYFFGFNPILIKSKVYIK